MKSKKRRRSSSCSSSSSVTSSSVSSSSSSSSRRRIKKKKLELKVKHKVPKCKTDIEGTTKSRNRSRHEASSKHKNKLEPATSKQKVADLKKKKKLKKDKNKLKKNRKTAITVEEPKLTESASKAKLKDDFNIPIDLMERSKQMAPMTKEQWEKQQSVVKRVFDETTGRSR